MVYSLLCAGSNSHGQLALAHDNDSHRFARLPTSDPQGRVSQVACGANHTLAVLQSVNGRRQLWAAGSNARGQLGPSLSAHSPILSLVPLDVGELARAAGFADTQHDVELVAACWETSFVVLRPRNGNGSDALLSFGANDWGERGSPGPSLNVTSEVDLAAPVAGRGKGRDVETRIRVLRLEAGPRHVVALLETTCPATNAVEHHLLGWGASRHGQLGAAPSATPLPKTTPTPRTIPLPQPLWASDVLDIAIGRDHTAVLLECRLQQSGEPSGIAAGRIVVLLGSNKHGQLGTISFTTSVEGAGTAAVTSHTKPRSPSQNVLTLSDFQHVLLNVPDYDIAAVGCTWNSTFIVLSPQLHSLQTPSTTAAELPQPLVIGFGLNSHGQLGSRTSEDSPPHPATSSSSTDQASATDARLIRLPSPSRSASASSPRTGVRLACGSEHALALVRPCSSANSATEAAVYGWGWNEHGNLGLSSPSEGEDLSDVWEPRRLWPMEGSGDVGGIVDVWAGNATSWIQVKGNGRRG